jgi:hypothetical protein
MLHLRHHVVVDDRHLDVVDHQRLHHQFLVYLIYTEMKMVRHQCVVENLHQLMDRRYVVHLDVLQILDELNLDVIPPFLDAELHLVNPADVVVDAELRHLLKMDCYLDAVDAELRHLLKMDCYLDEVQVLQAMEFPRHQLRGLLRAVLTQFWPPRALQLPLC